MEPILSESSESGDSWGGCIYCLTHPEQPGRSKIGCSKESNPEIRCSQANHDTWTLPLWKIEFAKKVKDPHYEEKRIHAFLVKDRVHPRREFFTTPIEKVKMIFDVIDGEYWDPNVYVESEDEAEECAASSDNDPSDSSDEEEYTKKAVGFGPKGNRTRESMRLCFKDGQRIRHVIKKNGGDVWYGTYSHSNNTIVRGDVQYDSLSTFAKEHRISITPTAGAPAEAVAGAGNGWCVCECEIENGKWIIADDAFSAATGSASSK